MRRYETSDKIAALDCAFIWSKEEAVIIGFI